MSLIYTSPTSRHNVSVSFSSPCLFLPTSLSSSDANKRPAVGCDKLFLLTRCRQLYLGGKADAKSLSTLQRRNVRSRILNVTPAKEQGITAGIPNYFENTSSSTIRYKRIPVYDAATSDLLSHADEMVEFISNGLHHGGVGPLPEGRVAECNGGCNVSHEVRQKILMRVHCAYSLRHLMPSN
ncbi:hypothetical protein ACHAW5_008406 [Stephanodiscus triporus]|uniref:Uncharacterized protein n=1 Tax=Stephanodiscus triporus TaxID=2934178 RepID=A0ABD3PFH6_9STRA